jgi:hypothetical protein
MFRRSDNVCIRQSETSVIDSHLSDFVSTTRATEYSINVQDLATNEKKYSAETFRICSKSCRATINTIKEKLLYSMLRIEWRNKVFSIRFTSTLGRMK